MTTGSEPAISLHSASDAAVVTAIVVAFVWVAVAMVLIAPHNQMSGIARTAPLPIKTLPKRPVMQLAFARSQDDINAVLDVGHDPQHDTIAAVDAGNLLDTIVLVPGYTLLLIAFTLLIARSSGHAGMEVFGAGLVVTVAIALADLAENQGIAMALTAAQQGEAMSAMARRLMVAAAFAKWSLLGLIGIALGVLMSLQGRGWGRRV